MPTETEARRPPLDTPEAAIYVSVRPNYLERLRCSGSGPTFIKHNGLVRYDPDDLDAWLEAGKRKSTADKDPEAPRDQTIGELQDVIDGKREWFLVSDADAIVTGPRRSVEKPGRAVSFGSTLAPDAGLVTRSLASAGDAAGLGGVSGFNEGNGLGERLTNAAKGVGIGALFGGALPVVGAIAKGVTAPIFANVNPPRPDGRSHGTS
jgi:hypothetical protein